MYQSELKIKCGTLQNLITAVCMFNGYKKRTQSSLSALEAHNSPNTHKLIGAHIAVVRTYEWPFSLAMFDRSCGSSELLN